MGNPKLIIYTSLIISLILSSSISQDDHQLAEASSSSSFTTHLIHRDSPSYNPSLSPFQRIANALKRSSSNHRQRRFQAKNTPQSGLIYSGGDFIMKFSIGSPPVPSLGIADTGSDVIWTQCQPCITCFNQSLPIFNPKTSRTYTNIPCNTKKCNFIQESYCSNTKENNCLYRELYGDQSSTYGELATDTFTFDVAAGGKKTVSVPDIIFGCGFKNGGIFSGIESGIVGLGGGKASLVRQLGGGKFSYCLNSFSNSSKLQLGPMAKVSGKQAVSTPLFNKFPETYYYMTLEGISVGNDQFEDGFGQDGNMIIDSGTTLTLLPTPLYDEVERAVKRWVKLKQIKDPAGVLSLCYFTRKDIAKIPEIIFHFKGADVRLSHDNVFVRTSDVAMCLAAKPTEDLPIYGNLAQVNFLVGYDLKKRTVSFKPTDCGKL